jgi:hypothetical protein
MKRLVSIAFFAAVLAPASAAMALEEAVARDLYINELWSGSIAFYLSHDASTHCAYESEWYNPLSNLSLECDVLERKVKGHLSCFNNRREDFVTTVESDWFCDGFDEFGIPRYVEGMFAGENWGLQGYVKFEGVPLPVSFETA